MRSHLLVCSLLYLSILCTRTVRAADDEEKDYKLFVDKLDKVIDAEDILQTNLNFDKTEDGEFKINGDVKQLIDLDNDWRVNITIYSAAEEGKEYHTFITLPVTGVCGFMKSYYKAYFYENLKNYANAPDPDVCPVRKEHYKINGYPVDCNRFKEMLRPGYYRIVAKLLHADELRLKYVLEVHVE